MDQQVNADFSSRTNGPKGGGTYGHVSREVSKLGDVVSDYISKQVGPRQSYFSALAEIWDELMPAGMQGHCALSDFSGGQLRVVVDSPVYLYELRLCQNELLRELQRRLRAVKRSGAGGMVDIAQPVRQLKFVVGGTGGIFTRGQGAGNK
jgi:hypothetical protein